MIISAQSIIAYSFVLVCMPRVVPFCCSAFVLFSFVVLLAAVRCIITVSRQKSVFIIKLFWK